MAGIEETLEICRRRIVDAVPDVTAVYAYGSRMMGAAHPQSDLDLALLMPRGERLPPVLRAQLQGDLESLLGFPVEITVLDPEMQLVHGKEVVVSGKVVYVRDAAAVAAFEMQVLSQYARFCEDRRPVVEAFTGGGDE